MSPDKGQGTIPLDDMRVRQPNGHAVLRKERKSTKPADKAETEAKAQGQKKETDVNADLAMQDGEQHEEAPVEVDIADFAKDEVTEASISPELVPTRRYTLHVPGPYTDGAQSDDDDFELAEMTSSVYAAAAEGFPGMESMESMENEDFMPPRRLADGDAARDEIREQAQLRQLQDAITRLTLEKESAEREATKARQQIADLKHLLNSDMEEIAKDTESLVKEMKRLKEENNLLREELNDAQSHIFSLQPYRKDLTPEEVGRQYDDLVESVQDWVQKFMGFWLDDYEAGVEALATHARKNSGEVTKFKKVVHKYPDLIHGCMFPETDEDIIVAIIMRFLNDHIFQKVLYGSAATYTEMVSFIETQMQTAVEPKRDLFAVRTWTAESYNALMSAPQFRSVRARRSRDLTITLADVLRIFCKKDKYQWFCQNMEERCIRPAMALYEKLQIATHHFYLDIQPYISWSGNHIAHSQEFYECVENLDCKNILHNRKAFNMNKLDPRPTKTDLYDNLLNVCTVVPALYIRQIGQRDAIKAPSIVRKQQVLVAWGPGEKREKFTEGADESLVHILCLPKARKKGESWLS
ncbi:hypothetical protein TASIC1_0001077500 [Trichoderma asperellum]|uniref:Uncharacterized protein n=1 Tax=Trichoderma asperellum TaxID=101201 RepID=A0A6V8QQ81_TRIAP|nr:hypothetical protein TASIC1_0001077500 [Trichoderma asperellum]